MPLDSIRGAFKCWSCSRGPISRSQACQPLLCGPAVRQEARKNQGVFAAVALDATRPASLRLASVADFFRFYLCSLEYALHAEGHSEVLSTILQCFILSFKQIKDLKFIPHLPLASTLSPSLTTLPLFVSGTKTFPSTCSAARPACSLLFVTLHRRSLTSWSLVRAAVDHCLGFTSMSVYHDRPISVSDPAIPLPTGEKDEAERKALNPLRRLFLETRAADEPSEGGHGGEDVVGKRVWMMDWREKVLRSVAADAEREGRDKESWNAR